MKIHEALKEMIENGKTIKVPFYSYYYKIGKKDWEKYPVVLRSDQLNVDEWKESTLENMLALCDGFSIFNDDWKISEEEK